tara:strand:- start:2739 stop:3950 length:1212 start_codon:yes stop_codon:yes gene_type:complete
MIKTKYSFFLIALIKVLFISTIYSSSGILSIGPVNSIAHTGVGGYQEVDTMVLNPAWLSDFSTKQRDRTITFGFFNFVPSFKSKLNLVSTTTEVDNDMGTIRLPYIGYLAKLSKTFTYGFGLFSGGGSGSNFTDAPEAFDVFYQNIDSFFTTTHIVNSIAYQKSKFNFGFSINVVSGALSTSVDDSSNVVGTSTTKIKLDTFSAATSYKYLIGFGYKFNDSFQAGLNYTSKLSLDFDDGDVSYINDEFTYSTKTIDEPSLLSAGLSVTNDKLKLNSDVHYIFWEDTNQAEYDWVNGTMINLGLHYTLIPNRIVTAVGYSQSSRIINSSTASNVSSLLVNTAFQPAILEKEISISTTLTLTKTFSTIFNVVYWPETSLTQTFSGIEGTLISSGYGASISTKMGF